MDISELTTDNKESEENTENIENTANKTNTETTKNTKNTKNKIIENVDDFLEGSILDDICIFDYDNNKEVITRGMYIMKGDNMWSSFNKRLTYRMFMKSKSVKIDNQSLYYSLIGEKYSSKQSTHDDWVVVKLSGDYGKKNFIIDKKNRRLFNIHPSYRIFWSSSFCNEMSIQKIKDRYELIYQFVRRYVKEDLLKKLHRLKSLEYNSNDSFDGEQVIINDCVISSYACANCPYGSSYFTPIYWSLLKYNKQIEYQDFKKIRTSYFDDNVEHVTFRIRSGESHTQEEYDTIIREIQRKSHTKIKGIVYLREFKMYNEEEAQKALYWDDQMFKADEDICSSTEIPQYAKNRREIVKSIRGIIDANYDFDYLCEILDDKNNEFIKTCIHIQEKDKKLFNKTFSSVQLHRIFNNSFYNSFYMEYDEFVDMSLYEDNEKDGNNIEGKLTIDVDV